MIKGHSAACANAAGSGARATGRACRWWAVPAALAVVIDLAACGGGGGGADGGATLSGGMLKVVVSDAFGTSVEGASIKGPLSTLQTDAKGVALLLVNGAATGTTIAVSGPNFEGQSTDVPLTPHQNNEIAITLVRATSAAGGSLTSRGAFLPSVRTRVKIT